MLFWSDMDKVKKAGIVKNATSISKQLLLGAIFLVSTLFIETVTFLLLGFNALPQYLILDVSIILIIIGIVLLIPFFKIQQTVFAIIIIIQIFLSYTNVTLYNIFGTIVTVDMINLVAEAVTAVELSVINITLVSVFVFIAIAYIAGNIIFSKSFKNVKTIKNTNKIKIALLTVICFLSIQFVGYNSYIDQVENFNSTSVYAFIGDDALLYDTLIFEAESLKKFGTFGFYFQDINSTLFNLEKDKAEKIVAANEYLDAGVNSTIGDYTGISEDNNLIVIMAESLEWYAIDEELTPTLYEMSQNNVSVNNYYSKSKTNISEAFGFLGSHPLTQGFASVLPGAAKLNKNNFDYSLPNLLKNDGYEGINYLINHKKHFYKRNETHNNFGFNDIFDISDFVVKDSKINYWGDWPLDSEFFKGAIETIAPAELENPFFNWITTMSMHGPYDGNYRLADYLDQIDASNWVNALSGTADENHLKNYQAAVMDLDRTVEYLLEELENRNLLETTTIAIYADHETYYHDLGLKIKGIDKADYQNPEVYRVPFIIYDDNLPSMQITDFACPYDIMPTLMDLFGISYNTNMYMGNSVFIEDENSQVFLSLTGGVFNKTIFTINGTDIISQGALDSTNKEEFLQSLEDLLRKVIKFNDLYCYNLFR